jgi:hypothetical protein
MPRFRDLSDVDLTDAPLTPSHPRPGNIPFYIEPDCDECQTLLVPFDHPSTPPEETWYDEWACPNCGFEIGTYMDWPEEEWSDLIKTCRMEIEESYPDAFDDGGTD